MKVRINLSVMTRMEFSEVIEVPDNTPDHVLDDIVQKRYDNADGPEFIEDLEYWEQGNCYWDKVCD